MTAVPPSPVTTAQSSPQGASEGGRLGFTENSLLGGRVRLLQPDTGYRAAIDPVLLAAAVPDGDWKQALDVGTGTGAAMLCLLARHAQTATLSGRSCRGIEVQEPYARLARNAVELNGFQDCADVLTADVRWRPPMPANSFDQVLTNPPFHGPGTRPPESTRATAHMEAMPLDVWIGFCLRMLKPRGSITIIHRADRLDDLLACLHGKTGAIEVIPLWPRVGESAKRVIVRARKAMKTPATLLPGLVLHTADGGYTPAAERVLRDGWSLDAAMGAV